MRNLMLAIGAAVGGYYVAGFVFDRTYRSAYGQCDDACATRMGSNRQIVRIGSAAGSAAVVAVLARTKSWR